LKWFGVEKDFARVLIGSAVGCKTRLRNDLEDLVRIHFGFHEFICLKFNLCLDEIVMISRERLSLQFHDSPEKVGQVMFSDF
jgi:tRNA A37 threonylcarbamoyltransferase TsaD